MAAQHVSTTSSGASNPSTGLTVNHTLGSGSDRMVITRVHAEGVDEIIGSMTFDGVSMNLAASATVQTPTWIYSLGEGSLPAGGSGYDAICDGFATATVIMGVSDYTGLKDQAAEATNSGDFGSGSSYTLDVTTVTDGALVVGAMGQDSGNTHTATGAQTERYAVTQGGDTLGTGGDILGGAAPDTVTYSGTMSGNRRNSVVLAVFEIATGGAGLAIGQATETDTAQVLSATKSAALAQASEADTASAMGATKAAAIGLATEADTGQAFGASKAAGVGQVTVVDLAQVMSGAKSAPVGQASEIASASALSSAKSAAIGQAIEVDVAQAFSAGSGAAIGQVVEFDTAQAFGASKSANIGQVAIVDSSQAFAGAKSAVIGQVFEVDVAQAMVVSGASAIGIAAEIDSAQLLGSSKAGGVGQASVIDAAQAFGATFSGPIATALESAIAHAFSASKSAGIGLALEIDTAFRIDLPLLTLDPNCRFVLRVPREYRTLHVPRELRTLNATR